MFTLFTIQKAGEGIILTTQLTIPRKLLGIFVFKKEFINRLGKKIFAKLAWKKIKVYGTVGDEISIYVLEYYFSFLAIAKKCASKVV